MLNINIPNEIPAWVYIFIYMPARKNIIYARMSISMLERAGGSLYFICPHIFNNISNHANNLYFLLFLHLYFYTNFLSFFRHALHRCVVLH